MNDRAEERLRVATHEAGHAVIAALLGLEVLSATIERDAASTGRTELRGDEQATPRVRVLLRMAGAAAEKAYGLADGLGCYRDQREAHEIALRSAGWAGVGPLLDELRAEVDVLVFQHSRAIGEVSIRLLRRGTVPGAKIHKLAARPSTGKRATAPGGGFLSPPARRHCLRPTGWGGGVT